MIDPLEWIEVADSLVSDGDEARIRAAIGRLYYALFIKNRDALAARGLLEVRGDDADHRAVFDALRSNRRASAAMALRDLRTYRNTSDYAVNAEVGTTDWRKARQLARDVIRLCSPDWAERT